MTANKPPVLAALDALNKVFDLIDESEGVAGLHLNGDLAPWSELTDGGRFEEWLCGLEKARADLQKWVDDVPDGKDSTTGHLGHIHNLAKHLLKGVSDD